MGTSRQQLETDWPALRKRINANFRAREIFTKNSNMRKEASIAKSNETLKTFLQENKFDDEDEDSEASSIVSPGQSNTSSQNSSQNDAN